jgi:hypothetical protein
MQFLRKAALAAAASLLVLTLSGFGFAWSAYQVFGTSQEIKQALDKSGIYKTVVGEVLKQHQNDQPSGGNPAGKVPVDQPQIRQIIGQAFPSHFLQSQAETVIDATYSWLSGKTPALQFNIDLGGAKTTLADGIGQYAGTRLASLPACTADNIPSGDIDAFNATCVPPGFDTNAAVAQARGQILNGDFLKDTNINASTLKTGNGKILAQQLHEAPGIYRRAKLAVYLGGMVALLLAVAVVFLAVTWRVGVRKIAVIALTVGIISALLGWLSSFAVHQVAHKIATMHSSNTSLQVQLVDIVQSLADSLRTNWVAYGIGLVVVGAGALIALHFTLPKNPIDLAPRRKPAKDEAEEGTATEKPAEPPIEPKPPHHSPNS